MVMVSVMMVMMVMMVVMVVMPEKEEPVKEYKVGRRILILIIVIIHKEILM